MTEPQQSREPQDPRDVQEGVAPDGLPARQAEEENLISVLVADHRDVERTLQEFESSNSSEQQRHLVEQLIVEIVRHSVAEEQYVYPAAREKLPDGDEVADRKIESRSEDEELMNRLAGTDPEGAQFHELSRQLAANIRHHIEEDETNFLPRLRQACSSEELQDLGKKVEVAEGSAPTRPHPSAPDSSPLNLVSDPAIGMVDRLRDRFAGRSGSSGAE
ncbi:hemerythrin domain-containing protein [Bounagaea algeriensis]